MMTLWNSPYNLAFNKLIVARVTAHNSYGWSTFSIPNTSGGRVMTVPSQMSAPLIVSYSDV